MIFEGIPSGDLECFCLLVTKKTFEEMTGRKPDPKYDVGRFAKKGSQHRYMLYPGDMLGLELNDKGDVFVISVEATKKKEVK
jgi:hypothetical protein